MEKRSSTIIDVYVWQVFINVQRNIISSGHMSDGFWKIICSPAHILIDKLYRFSTMLPFFLLHAAHLLVFIKCWFIELCWKLLFNSFEHRYYIQITNIGCVYLLRKFVLILLAKKLLNCLNYFTIFIHFYSL